jgi:hypothetical protein
MFTVSTNTLPGGRSSREDKPAPSVSNNPDAQDPIPSGWRQINAYGKFSFYLPPDMRDTGIRGIENLHSEYSNGRMHLSFDYEPFGFMSYDRRVQAKGKDFQEVELQVDGKKSFLFVHQETASKNRRVYYNVDLYVGDLPTSEVLLRMWVRSRSARDVKTAKAIFRTIKFAAS